MNLNEQ